jgi:hypothetical protein
MRILNLTDSILVVIQYIQTQHYRHDRYMHETSLDFEYKARPTQ